jgi:hypothetical protein
MTPGLLSTCQRTRHSRTPFPQHAPAAQNAKASPLLLLLLQDLPCLVQQPLQLLLQLSVVGLPLQMLPLLAGAAAHPAVGQRPAACSNLSMTSDERPTISASVVTAGGLRCLQLQMSAAHHHVV